MLAAYNLRLHKIVSNDSNATQAFPKEDRASHLHNPDFSQDTIPMQCTVRKIAKTVYMVTSSKWRRCLSPVVMDPFHLLLFSSIVYAKSDCAHVHIDKE